MSKFAEKDVQEIYESAMQDPNLFAELDITHLLDGIDDEKYENIENKTINSINEDIFDVVKPMSIEINNKKDICKRLIGYKYISELHEIENGKHIRWIKHGTNKLTNGGIVVNTKFTDDGAQIVCLNNARRFNQVKMNSNEIFQKLSPEEQILLMANEYLHA